MIRKVNSLNSPTKLVHSVFNQPLTFHPQRVHVLPLVQARSHLRTLLLISRVPLSALHLPTRMQIITDISVQSGKFTLGARRLLPSPRGWKQCAGGGGAMEIARAANCTIPRWATGEGKRKITITPTDVSRTW